MSRQRIRLGKTGEDLACRELERRGYVILARGYRRRMGELDIVARDGRTLVFVEVKTREGCRFGEPAAAITRLKQRTIARLALEYVVRHGLYGSACRFDVVSIQMAAGQPRVEVFQNAFDAGAT